jgi:hypothetical protein
MNSHLFCSILLPVALSFAAAPSRADPAVTVLVGIEAVDGCSGLTRTPSPTQ